MKINVIKSAHQWVCLQSISQSVRQPEHHAEHQAPSRRKQQAEGSNKQKGTPRRKKHHMEENITQKETPPRREQHAKEKITQWKSMKSRKSRAHSWPIWPCLLSPSGKIKKMKKKLVTTAEREQKDSNYAIFHQLWS